MNKKCILLVEDNPSDINLTKRAFSKSNIANELVVVRDGQEALDYLYGAGPYADRNLSDIPAVILLDLKLPKIDGITVLREIKSHHELKKIPVVVLTTSDEENDLDECYRLGVNSYIRKPVEFDKFAEIVSLLGLYWLVINEPPPASI